MSALMNEKEHSEARLAEAEAKAEDLDRLNKDLNGLVCESRAHNPSKIKLWRF